MDKIVQDKYFWCNNYESVGLVKIKMAMLESMKKFMRQVDTWIMQCGRIE